MHSQAGRLKMTEPHRTHLALANPREKELGGFQRQSIQKALTESPITPSPGRSEEAFSAHIFLLIRVASSVEPSVLDRDLGDKDHLWLLQVLNSELPLSSRLPVSQSSLVIAPVRGRSSNNIALSRPVK
jgi:hypothetical protein